MGGIFKSSQLQTNFASSYNENDWIKKEYSQYTGTKLDGKELQRAGTSDRIWKRSLPNNGTSHTDDNDNNKKSLPFLSLFMESGISFKHSML